MLSFHSQFLFQVFLQVKVAFDLEIGELTNAKSYMHPNSIFLFVLV